MRHGRFMGYGYNGSIILFIILLLVVIAFIVFLNSFFSKRSSSPNEKYLNILNERYINDEINADKYMEIRMLLEDEESEDYSILILKEKYARGEISREEFLQSK